MPFRANSDTLLRHLQGAVRSSCRPSRLTEPLVTEADRSDWRTVDLQQLGEGQEDEGLKFYDLPRLRVATSLKLKQPRVGFFTTPAFFARHETNEDNSFRVTVNQALIVALGQGLDAESTLADAATQTLPPVDMSAVEAEHTMPGTTCAACHASLDPMRLYFKNAFDVTYRARQEDNQESNDDGNQAVPVFDLDGQSITGGDLMTFGQALAIQPRFAGAWAQKVCRWATSQACLATDPEFARVVAAFESSGYKFKTLLREMLSSPLVTGAAETQSQTTKVGTVVSIARRAHVCNALAARLQVPDLCALGRIKRLVLAIPDDVFERGAPSPSLAMDSTLMSSGGIESLCAYIAELMVDRTYRGERRFPRNDLQASLKRLVTDVMAIPESDSRFEPLLDLLTLHYVDAMGEIQPEGAPVEGLTPGCPCVPRSSWPVKAPQLWLWGCNCRFDCPRGHGPSGFVRSWSHRRRLWTEVLGTACKRVRTWGWYCKVKRDALFVMFRFG